MTDTTTDAQPHDADAERFILGACLLSNAAFDDMRHALTSSDFYDQNRAGLWHVYGRLRDQGVDLSDFTAIIDEAKRAGVDVKFQDLTKLMAGTSSTSGYARWVQIVLRWAVYRRVLIAAEDIKIKAREGLLEGDELLDLATSKIAGIERPVGTGTVDGLSTFDEFLDREADSEPWLIPGLLRRSWRTMLVAPEGVGKSMVARALVLGASQGLAPFGGPNFEPIRCLMIDCENPEDAVRSTCKPIRARAKMHTSEYASWRSWLWHRPGGLNIRTRTDRQDLERVIAAAQPDLVCAGPMYKLYRPGKEGDEQAGLDVMNLFDDLRTRYGFALVLEHHAPKAQGASNIRELVPYGTSLWLRWPELGIKLIPSSDYKDSLELGRFRPDRMPTAWPDRLDRGIQGAWPWTGYWKNGDMP